MTETTSERVNDRINEWISHMYEDDDQTVRCTYDILCKLAETKYLQTKIHYHYLLFLANFSWKRCTVIANSLRERCTDVANTACPTTKILAVADKIIVPKSCNEYAVITRIKARVYHESAQYSKAFDCFEILFHFCTDDTQATILLRMINCYAKVCEGTDISKYEWMKIKIARLQAVASNSMISKNKRGRKHSK